MDGAVMYNNKPICPKCGSEEMKAYIRKLEEQNRQLEQALVQLRSKYKLKVQR